MNTFGQMKNEEMAEQKRTYKANVLNFETLKNKYD